MKARIYTSVSFGLALSVLPFVGGCTEQSADRSSPLIGSASAEPTGTAVLTNALTETPAPVVAEADLAAEEDLDAKMVIPAPAAASEKKLPANLKPTAPVAEIVKLAQSGVDETVMLNYITNTTSLFVLTPDDIIYLSDLGVVGPVITAMMQHDQALKATAANEAAQAAQAATQAAAPTYVDPPPAEPQPEPQPASVETAPPPVNVTQDYFYDSLSPYGTWVDVAGYGRCWQPTVVVVNRGWRPYCDGGRWVYTDHGWYWYSDYSWGASTFHYGRWFNHASYGWCWWPDTVWGPSWVTFRYSGDYCGWAPLPPLAYYHSGVGFSYCGQSVGFGFGFGLSSSCYTFVSWNRFCDSRPWHHRVPAHEARRVYDRTTVANNYVTGNNRNIINKGISAERYRQHARAELRPVALREVNASPQTGVRSERLNRERRTMVVSRPRDPGQGLPPRPTAAGPSAGTPVATSLADAAGGNVAPSPSSGRERGQAVESRDFSRLAANASTLEPSKVEPRVATAPVQEPTQPRPGPQPLSAAPPPEAPKVPAPRLDRDDRTPASRTEMSPAVRPNRGVPSSTPSSSLVVIGKRDQNNNGDIPARPSPGSPVEGSSSLTRPSMPPAPVAPSRNNSYDPRSAQDNRSAAGVTTRNESAAPRVTANPGYNLRPTPTISPPPGATTRPIQRAPAPESNRPQNPQGFSAPRSYTPPPTYSAPVVVPAPRNAPSPSYTPRPSPAPSYSAPAPAVSAPSYTPRPAPSAPAPAASAPRPAPSSNARSESGGRNSSR